jgi:GAF domain-containing protein
MDSDGACKGNMQLYDKQKDILRIIVNRGFTDDFLTHFKYVRPFDPTACGRAAASGHIVQIDDVMEDRTFAQHRAAAAAAGFRAVRSIPVFKEGRLVGVTSMHFAEPLYGPMDVKKASPVISAIANILGSVNVLAAVA